MMRNEKLRLKYKVEKSRPGIVYPGADHEPSVTITVRGGTIRYRLISYVLDQIDAISWEGDLSQEVLDDVNEWVKSNLPSLLMEADVHHTIQFRTGSRCYYDFQSQTLYGGDGYKEKAGSSDGVRKNTVAINGKPVKLPKSVIPFIEVLTKTPGAEYPSDTFLENTDDKYADKITPANLNQRFFKFKRYDSSIEATFHRGNDRSFKYEGNPQIWRVGGEAENGDLTIEKIFKIVGQHDIIAIFDSMKRQLSTTLASDISPEETVAFLGLNEALFDPGSMDVARFFSNNYCDSVDALKSLLTRYCGVTEAVWNQLRVNIKNNLSHSLSASTFYSDTKGLPPRLADLNGYPVTEERLLNSLRRIAPAVKELIQNTNIGVVFFRYCKIDVPPDKVIDCIAALVMACFCNCQTPSNDEELLRLMERYQQKLLILIRRKFDYDPPPSGDGKNGNMDEVRRELKRLLEQAEEDGLDHYVAAISKIYDSLILGYDDDNGLLPPTMGRGL